jgi:hypothetical protein
MLPVMEPVHDRFPVSMKVRQKIHWGWLRTKRLDQMPLFVDDQYDQILLLVVLVRGSREYYRGNLLLSEKFGFPDRLDHSSGRCYQERRSRK